MASTRSTITSEHQQVAGKEMQNSDILNLSPFISPITFRACVWSCIIS